MKARLRAGESPGLLAIRGDRAVGWCALGRRDRFRQYDDLEGGAAAWAIPCLYIDPRADRRSVARALIAAAAERAAEAAATAIDGPPPWWLPGDEAAIALATETFLENGFVRTGRGARMPGLQRRLQAVGGIE